MKEILGEQLWYVHSGEALAIFNNVKTNAAR